ncbi:MAG: 1-deoxy-D-xylulose-5-phosphate reductoisomerase [Phycisphaerales bacterium]|nr:1-deoxy-D-xylulose-5-phosphate reductoisomerase [Phycisphaerales bacterium]
MPATSRTRRVIVLGCTGSIGRSTLHVIEHLNSIEPGSLEIVGLATGSNVELMREQAQRHQVRHLAVAKASSQSHPDTDPIAFTGDDAARRLVEEVECDIVVAAIVGSAGLSAVAAAIERGCDIALANKETLVAAGEIIMPLAERRGVNILPVDSEHSAIFQCLQSRSASGAAPDRPMCLDHIRRIVLTASGGPFRTWPAERIAEATVEQALSHPTWKMGAKITIDSASMTNKALEVIEAKWLFGLDARRIEVIVHPQSIIHSLVEFDDGSVLAQLGAPDMRTPIQYALTWPARPPGCATRIDWAALRRLDFEAPDEDRFPALRLARHVVETGGTSGAIFNAANEEAVAAFLDGRIAFGRISQLAEEALDAIEHGAAQSLDEVMDADHRARQFVRSTLAQGAGQRHSARSR